jgi:hypothetical protein
MHRNLETYCKNVELEKYDVFLILSGSRFTENDLLLAQKVKLLNKSVFFIRTHIDVDCKNESQRKKSFYDQATVLQNIKDDCCKSLEGSEFGHDAVFLISNLDPSRWDFDHLRQAIAQSECITLSRTSYFIHRGK